MAQFVVLFIVRWPGFGEALDGDAVALARLTIARVRLVVTVNLGGAATAPVIRDHVGSTKAGTLGVFLYVLPALVVHDAAPVRVVHRLTLTAGAAVAAVVDVIHRLQVLIKARQHVAKLQNVALCSDWSIGLASASAAHHPARRRRNVQVTRVGEDLIQIAVDDGNDDRQPDVGDQQVRRHVHHFPLPLRVVVLQNKSFKPYFRGP